MVELAKGARGEAAGGDDVRTGGNEEQAGAGGKRGTGGKGMGGKGTGGKGKDSKGTGGRGTGQRRGRGKAGPKARQTLAARRAAFLKELRVSLNVSAAARKAGIGNSTVYRHRQANARFRAEWDAALTEALDDVESNLFRRAIEGTEKPVFYRGAQVGSVRTYSDALAMFLLRAKRPEVYARLAGAGAGAAAGVPSPAEMTEDEAREEVRRRLDRLAEGPGDDHGADHGGVQGGGDAA